MPYYRAFINQDAYITHDYVIEADDPQEAVDAGIDQWKGRREDVKLVESFTNGYDHVDPCDPEDVEEITKEEYEEELAAAEKPAVDPMRAAVEKAIELLGEWLTDKIPEDGVFEDEPEIDRVRSLLQEALL